MIEWIAVPGAISYNIYGKDTIEGEYNRRWNVTASPFIDDMLDTGVTFITPAQVGATGPVPTLYVGTERASDGTIWHRHLVCGHAVKEVTAIFVDGVRGDPTGGTFSNQGAVPGYSGYPLYFPNTGFPQYRDINGRRYTIIYGRGPVSERVARGEQKLTACIKGIETVGDGTGGMIFQIHDQYFHALKNWFLGDYQSGNWLPMPNWEADPDGAIWPKIDELSFTTARAISIARIGGRGYLGATIIGSFNEGQKSLQEWLARFNMSADVDSGFNRHSQFKISMLNENAIANPTKYSPSDNVIKESVVIEARPDLLQNVIIYNAKRDWAGEIWEVNEARIRDNLSVTKYGEEKISQVLEFWCVTDAGTYTNIALHRLNRYKEIMTLVTFRTTMAGLSDDLGDVIPFSHYEGLTATGWVDRPLRILTHRANPQTYVVTITAQDIARLLNTPFDYSPS
jgi:hypothetical protein